MSEATPSLLTNRLWSRSTYVPLTQCSVPIPGMLQAMRWQTIQSQLLPTMWLDRVIQYTALQHSLVSNSTYISDLVRMTFFHKSLSDAYPYQRSQPLRLVKVSLAVFFSGCRHMLALFPSSPHVQQKVNWMGPGSKARHKYETPNVTQNGWKIIVTCCNWSPW